MAFNFKGDSYGYSRGRDMSAHYRDKGPLDCKVYVGNLGSRAPKQEIESEFARYGRLRNVWVARNPPGFAFVEFEDGRDAEDACRGLNNRIVCGRRVIVEKSSGKSRHGRYGGPSRSRYGGGGGGGGGYGGGYGGYGGGRYRDRAHNSSIYNLNNCFLNCPSAIT